MVCARLALADAAIEVRLLACVPEVANGSGTGILGAIVVELTGVFRINFRGEDMEAPLAVPGGDVPGRGQPNPTERLLKG
jgi:hypothetical protein